MSCSVLNFLSFFIKKLLSRGIFPFIYIIHFIATITSRCKTDAQLNFNRDRGAWHDICPAKENLNKKIIWLLSPSNFCLLLLARSRRRSEGLILIYFISMINFHPLNTSLFLIQSEMYYAEIKPPWWEIQLIRTTFYCISKTRSAQRLDITWEILRPTS